MNNFEVIVLVAIVWNIFGYLISIPIMLEEYASAFSYYNMDKLSPVYIYRNTRCNIFGVICLTIVMNLLCPIMSICYWFYKLCTVGRK